MVTAQLIARRERTAQRAAELEQEEQRALSLGVNLAQLRTPAVLSYDTARHQFRELITACIGLDSNGCAADQSLLENLHTVPPSAEDERGVRGRGGNRGPSTVWIQRWLRVPPRRAAHDAFNEARTLRSIADCVLMNSLPSIRRRTSTFCGSWSCRTSATRAASSSRHDI